ncbi:MAG TPA: class I SAM-dependent methyltransferase [Verrucomicrobiae bacterium]|nr:class I SAM-dependent methyltransferase [Verrucomicrobiae bacterium]
MSSSNNYDSFAKQRAQDFASGSNLVHAYIEKPAMYALVPPLEGKSVLCVGCGTGEECSELKERGAKVTGIDISKASIDYAIQHVPAVNFQVMDIDSSDNLLSLGKHQFDLIYSSLTLHYSNNLDILLRNLRHLLTPGGLLLFSVGHPIRWAAKVEEKEDVKSVVLGYKQGQGETEIFGDYLSTRQFRQKLSDGPEVTYWMRPISAYLELLKKNRYELIEFKEPSPIDSARQVDENFWNLRSMLPVDMVFLVRVQD